MFSIKTDETLKKICGYVCFSNHQMFIRHNLNLKNRNPIAMLDHPAAKDLRMFGARPTAMSNGSVIPWHIGND